jgi:hypothetical protein
MYQNLEYFFIFLLILATGGIAGVAWLVLKGLFKGQK